MEKLEKKIEEILSQNWKGEYGNSELDEKQLASSIASEVQDIAIAFADYKEDHINDIKQGYASSKPDTALFTEFIKQYYK